MDEKDDLKNQLKGMANYIDWFHRFKQECYLNDWLLQNGDYSADIVKIKAIKKHMMKTISNQAIGYFDASKSIQENMTVLSNSFGQGYTDANDQIEIVKSNIWFNPKKNPMRVFTWLNKQIRIIAAAGSGVTDAMKLDIIIPPPAAAMILDSYLFVQDSHWIFFRIKPNIRLDDFNLIICISVSLTKTVRQYSHIFLDGLRGIKVANGLI
jgi:hypothetical protein